MYLHLITTLTDIPFAACNKKDDEPVASKVSILFNDSSLTEQPIKTGKSGRSKSRLIPATKAFRLS